MAESQTKSRQAEQKMCQLSPKLNLLSPVRYGQASVDILPRNLLKVVLRYSFLHVFSAGERLRRREARGKRQEVTSRQ
jgi:hypothetical protein